MTTRDVRDALSVIVGPDKAMRAKVGGGPAPDFSGGWASIPFRTVRGHFWRPSGATALRRYEDGRKQWLSLCGLVGETSDRVPAMLIGDFDYCKRCAGKLGRAPNATEKGIA